MKIYTRLFVLALVLAMVLFVLVGCDKSKSIKEAFEAEGYTVNAISVKNERAKAIFTLLNYTEEEIDEIEEYELIYCANGLLNGALIVKYPSSLELREELIDEGSKVYYEEEMAAGRINGNCHLIYAIGGAEDIFAATGK